MLRSTEGQNHLQLAHRGPTVLVAHVRLPLLTVCSSICRLQKDLFTDRTGEYWGKFGAVQNDIQQAYSGNAVANVDAASAGMVG